MIWFVGAGCYHPDMLTIGAKKLLEQADCVLSSCKQRISSICFQRL